MSSTQENTIEFLSALNTRRENTQSHSGVDSRGSSVFDLPVHSEETPMAVSRPRIWDQTQMQASSSGSRIESQHTAQAELDSNLSEHSYLVISGGTGCNSICSAFGDACYILPVSDDGGSSSEIIRVIGGPSIGLYSYNWDCSWC